MPGKHRLPGPQSRWWVGATAVLPFVLLLLAACAGPKGGELVKTSPQPTPVPTWEQALQEPTNPDLAPGEDPEPGLPPDLEASSGASSGTDEPGLDQTTPPEGHLVQAMPPDYEVVPPSLPPARTGNEACGDREPELLPRPGAPGSGDFWLAFRAPLPPAPAWNPPGPKRVGLQAGHWRNNEVPPELSRLVGSGTSGGGRAEWEVNLDLARRAAAILEGYGVQVDILPATVPPSYRAHAFLSIHADGDPAGALRGFKAARAGFSPIPEADDALVEALNREYAAATGLPRDGLHISRRMTYYYAFNSRRYCHALAPGVPAAIIETGFLTNATDREVLLGRPETAARGIARGVLSFLGFLEPSGP